MLEIIAFFPPTASAGGILCERGIGMLSKAFYQKVYKFSRQGLEDTGLRRSKYGLRVSVVMRISRENFIHILNDFPEISRALLYSFAERIYEKSAMAQVWVGHSPEEKIEQFLIKNKQKNVEDGENEDDENLVLFTRQQIADFTGLRVETVIRTLKKMSESGKVKIINHKLYY